MVHFKFSKKNCFELKDVLAETFTAHSCVKSVYRDIDYSQLSQSLKVKTYNKMKPENLLNYPLLVQLA